MEQNLTPANLRASVASYRDRSVSAQEREKIRAWWKQHGIPNQFSAALRAAELKEDETSTETITEWVVEGQDATGAWVAAVSPSVRRDLMVEYLEGRRESHPGLNWRLVRLDSTITTTVEAVSEARKEPVGRPLSRESEPPVGTWARDRFGGLTMRQEDGWGAPGSLPFGRWEAMWDARGPYVEVGPWGLSEPS